MHTYISLVPRPFITKQKGPGNLSEFKLLTSTALLLAVPIRFQNALRDSCRILNVSLIHHSITNIELALGMMVCSNFFC